MIKKPISHILNNVFVDNKEAVLVSYLSEIIEEALQQTQILDYNDLYSLIAEPLNDYQFCSNEQESCSSAHCIFDGLVQQQYIQNPTIIRQKILKSIRIGMNVTALYWEDRQWYDATINDIDVIDSLNKISVTFTGYTAPEWIDPLYIQIQPQNRANSSHKKIKIADEIHITDGITDFINYQIYHGADKPRNDAMHIHEAPEKTKHKRIKTKIKTLLEEKQIELENDIRNSETDEYSEDMLRANGHYFCYKPKCNGYIYQPNHTKMTQYICPDCKSRNCVICSSIHQTELKLSNQSSIHLECDVYQFLFNNQFIKYWQFTTRDAKTKAKTNVLKYLRKQCTMCRSFGVRKNSVEWQWVIRCMKVTERYCVTKIERIQNTNLWNKYYDYYQSLVINGTQSKVMNVWHGTNRTKPGIIWRGIGFDVGHSKVAGCIWFAVNNCYSMDGFKHCVDLYKSKVLLSFVVAGNDEDVKLIRNDSILNVFKNEATYPAYVVTYTRE